MLLTKINLILIQIRIQEISNYLYNFRSDSFRLNFIIEIISRSLLAKNNGMFCESILRFFEIKKKRKILSRFNYEAY